MRLACCLQLHSQMFQLLLVSLVLQVFIVSCEELDPTTTPDYEYDYKDFEVIYHAPDSFTDWYNFTEYTEWNSASSIYPNYFTIVALLLSYLICLVFHQGLHGSTSVCQKRST